MDYSSQLSQPEFQTFVRDWMIRLELYLQLLVNNLKFLDQQDESKLQQLITRVVTHYHDYFHANAQVCRQNVFLVLSPPWFSSYERTFLWLGGFKPGLAVYVTKTCGLELNPGQAERLERLISETKNEEREIMKRLARLEQQVVAPPMLVVARMGGNEVNGMVSEADIAVDRMAEDMEVLVGCADNLREKTLVKVVGILTTAQMVRFLAALGQLQLRIRRWGWLMESETPGYADLQ